MNELLACWRSRPPLPYPLYYRSFLYILCWPGIPYTKWHPVDLASLGRQGGFGLVPDSASTTQLWSRIADLTQSGSTTKFSLVADLSLTQLCSSLQTTRTTQLSEYSRRFRPLIKEELFRSSRNLQIEIPPRQQQWDIITPPVHGIMGDYYTPSRGLMGINCPSVYGPRAASKLPRGWKYPWAHGLGV